MAKNKNKSACYSDVELFRSYAFLSSCFGGSRAGWLVGVEGRGGGVREEGDGRRIVRACCSCSC